MVLGRGTGNFALINRNTMKNLFIATIAVLLAVPAFSQSNKIPPNKRESTNKVQAPPNNPNYGKNATKHSKKDMSASVGKFQNPKHQDAVKGKNAKKAAKGGKGE